MANFLTGGLSLQVEHHLFPAISFLHYPAISRIVASECAARGIPYARYPGLPEAIAAFCRCGLRLLQNLKRVIVNAARAASPTCATPACPRPSPPSAGATLGFFKDLKRVFANAARAASPTRAMPACPGLLPPSAGTDLGFRNLKRVLRVHGARHPVCMLRWPSRGDCCLLQVCIWGLDRNCRKSAMRVLPCAMSACFGTTAAS